jgi:hypothetical protein
MVVSPTEIHEAPLQVDPLGQPQSVQQVAPDSLPLQTPSPQTSVDGGV